MITPQALTEMVQRKQLSHTKAIHLYSAFYGGDADSHALMLPCETCGTLVPFAEMVAYKVWVPMPGDPDVPGFDEHDQHFCCSHDCAQQAVHDCIGNHLRPMAEQRNADAKREREALAERVARAAEVKRAQGRPE